MKIINDLIDWTTVGDLSELTTTDQSTIVAALNEVKANRDEPFRIKKWEKVVSATIPYCTQDLSNTAIDKMTFRITGDSSESLAIAI